MVSDTSAKGKGAALPSHPKCLWDMKQVSWTDGKGPQDRYTEAVKR